MNLTLTVRPELVEGPFLLLGSSDDVLGVHAPLPGGSYYTGHTDDLDSRIAQHQSGMIPGFTRDYAPVVLVWSQEFASRIEALETEQRIKGWSKAKKMALIRGDWASISKLAKKNGPSTSSGRTGEKDVPLAETLSMRQPDEHD